MSAIREKMRAMSVLRKGMVFLSRIQL